MNRPRPNSGSPLGATAILGLALLTTGNILADDEVSDLQELKTWMTGNFSNAVQAAEDPEFFDLTLHVAPIWPDPTDGHWFYVEQAVRMHRDRPYRQRIFRLRELAPGLFESQVFTIPNPTAAVGAWRAEDPLTDLEPADLAERDGCAILLRRRDDTFIGSTIASLCTSSLRGAAYATSEVVVTPDGVVSWDRGFAADGRQVWGATKGGTVFDRIVPDEDEAPFDPDPESDSDSDSEDAAEPLRTLARYRTTNGKILFGQNLVHRGKGLVQVGDEVVAIARR